MSSSEPILKDESNRFTIYPIKHLDIWEAYETHKKAFWTAQEIDFTADLDDWNSLNDNEKYFIENILAFFAGSDGIVLENLVSDFCNQVKIPEARCFYMFQAMIENIHGEVYSQLIETFVQDTQKKLKLFDAINTIPAVTKKAEWALKWINKDIPFATRLVAFAIVEGVFFSGSFCSIFWLKNRGKMTKALGLANEFIARDEGMHCVVPETKILTKQGYKQIIDCINKNIEIWNGFEWSNVIPIKTGENKEILKVKLDNGVELECTKQHKWVVVSDETKNRQQKYFKFIRKNTKDLVKGDIIEKFKMPIIDNELELNSPYTNGLFSADGYYDRPNIKNPWIKFKRQDKKDLIEYLDYKWVNECKDDYINIRLNKDNIVEKYFVPINYSINTKLRWLEGVVDGDGCLNFCPVNNKCAIQLTSIHKSFLTDIQLLLNTLGCINNVKLSHPKRNIIINEKECGVKELYCIYITCNDIVKLQQIGFNPKRLKIPTLNNDNKSFSRFIRVEDIKNEGRISDTYCFTEEKNHTGIFNGIMTGQCDFAILLYNNYIKNKMTDEKFNEIMKEAVEIEREFICDSLPCNLIGMNSDLMCEYIQFVADRLCIQLGYSKIYNIDNPFSFMDTIGLEGMTNFFESRVSQYQHSSSVIRPEDKHFELSEDF